MIYQFRDKKQIIRKKKIIKTIFIFIIFSILSTLLIFSTIDGFWNRVGFPFWKSKMVVSEEFADSGYLFRTKKSVFSKNRELVIENINLKNSILDYQIIKDENIKLKELLGRTPSQSDFVLSSILSKPSNSPYDTIIIDIGENFNINEGDKVYANAIIPVGEIEKIYKNTALVVLYSSPGRKTIGTIEELNSTIELVGRGGGNFEMTVPVDLIVEKGRSILLPGIQPEIIATIGDVISAPNDPIKKFILYAPINVQDLKWVQVLKN